MAFTASQALPPQQGFKSAAATVTTDDSKKTPVQVVSQILKGAVLIADAERPATINDFHAAMILRDVVETGKLFISGKRGAFSDLEKQVMRNEIRDIERVIGSLDPKGNVKLIVQLKESGLASSLSDSIKADVITLVQPEEPVNS